MWWRGRGKKPNESIEELDAAEILAASAETGSTNILGKPISDESEVGLGADSQAARLRALARDASHLKKLAASPHNSAIAELDRHPDRPILEDSASSYMRAPSYDDPNLENKWGSPLTSASDANGPLFQPREESYPTPASEDDIVSYGLDENIGNFEAWYDDRHDPDE